MNYITHEDELVFDDFVVFYFYAPWMPFTRKMVQMIEKVPEELGFQFLAIDVDYFGNIAERFKVETVPTCLTFKNKKVIDTLNGVTYTKAFLHHFSELKKKHAKSKENP